MVLILSRIGDRAAGAGAAFAAPDVVIGAGIRLAGEKDLASSIFFHGGTPMSDTITLEPVISLPSGFNIHEVSTRSPRVVSAKAAAPTLGPLAHFTGNWKGSGFNTIFRPQNPATPTDLPVPVPTSDNILELNLTTETLSFSPSLGSVPNRGELQGDIFLNGVPYLQSINDVTTQGQSTGIHLEPGLWVIVPATTDPAEGLTLTRMASIPHGTTINAQGTSFTIAGPPVIAPVNITPTTVAGGTLVPFPSQTAATQNTPRIPQDLTSFVAAGTITQAMLDDPNTVLRNHIVGQNITSTTVIAVSTNPNAPLFGGGTDNIAFLLADAAGANPNADATQMSAIFWIETVEHELHIPLYTPGQPPLIVAGTPSSVPGQMVPKFSIHPPFAVTAPRTIRFTSTQIQYTQLVMLKFKGLNWPHVSVATLVPADPIIVPPSIWT
jgi:hypothetical protein